MTERIPLKTKPRRAAALLVLALGLALGLASGPPAAAQQAGPISPDLTPKLPTGPKSLTTDRHGSHK